MSWETEHWSSPNGCHPDCPACAAERFQCQNCDERWREDQLDVLSDAWERVQPGDTMPDGECPDCGGMCFALELIERDAAEAEVRKALLNDCEVMLSRVEAILACEDAVSLLCSSDVFGPGYEDLLRADAESLRTTINKAKPSPIKG